MTDTSKLEQIALHSMDWGTVSGVISAPDHSLAIEPWYADCGVTGERLECSCGWRSEEFSGYGCWQHGHDGPPISHVFDETHDALYEAALKWLRQ